MFVLDLGGRVSGGDQRSLVADVRDVRTWSKRLTARITLEGREQWLSNGEYLYSLGYAKVLQGVGEFLSVFIK